MEKNRQTRTDNSEEVIHVIQKREKTLNLSRNYNKEIDRHTGTYFSFQTRRKNTHGIYPPAWNK